jgi:hypothetical protein
MDDCHCVKIETLRKKCPHENERKQAQARGPRIPENGLCRLVKPAAKSGSSAIMSNLHVALVWHWG